MTQPKIADTKPMKVDLEPGEHYWCSCGESKGQPFCDGSHRGTPFTPLAFKVEEAKPAAMCLCKQSANTPYCDGAHAKLKKKKDAPAKSPTAASGAWHKVAEANQLADGQSIVVQAGGRTIALTCVGNKYGAIDNVCPHQGGPLGEGTLDERGFLRCPWHGWGFHPVTGESHKGAKGDPVTCFPIEIRDDGIYIQVKEAPVEHETTVSDVMVETMINWGVTHVFGIVGHSNLGLAEAIRKMEAQGRITFIGVRHEGAAAFACSGFAKANGKPAACLTIAGPGATNLLTGLWDAKVDRAPVLALTGQVNTQVLGPGAFQEIDLSSAFQAVSAWSQTVLHSTDHAELMTLALKNAIVHRDVAHLIFPDEVQVLPVDKKAAASEPDGRISASGIAPPPGSVDSAVSLISDSKRPAIIVGYGARESMDAIVALAERLTAPVLTTFKGKGQMSDEHPLATGVLGRSGTPIASSCMADADLLIVFGASFANHTGISRGKSTIQVDFDRMALGKFFPVTVPVWGEIGVTAQLMGEKLANNLAAEDQRPRIAQLWKDWRAEKERRASLDRGKGLSSAIVFAHLTDAAPDDAVISVDVGNNTYSFGRYFECRRQTILMSGYLGSIGFGFPAAMGAWAACPDRPIVCVCGDGGFGQYLAEFTTAVKHSMNITIVLLNNHELGKISKEQRNGHWKVWQTSLQNPNFADFAKNCGGWGVRVTKVDQLDSAFRDALAHDGPVLVEIITDAELI